jgi:hypothetical protein
MGSNLTKHVSANLFVLVVQRESPGSWAHNGGNNTLQRRQIAANLSNIV